MNMNSLADNAAERVGEAATSVISNAAGAVTDPKTAVQMVKSKSRRAAPLVLLVVVLALVLMFRRNRGS